jgi:hypothetical protein
MGGTTGVCQLHKKLGFLQSQLRAQGGKCSGHEWRSFPAHANLQRQAAYSQTMIIRNGPKLFKDPLIWLLQWVLVGLQQLLQLVQDAYVKLTHLCIRVHG